MKLNTKVKLADGRIGTVCFHDLVGTGISLGEHTFQMPSGGYGDELPVPDVMLRTPFDFGYDVEFCPDYEVLA